ncbi:MAG: bifunctional molybdenum cofactor biosynthesis protein MoaC/MoaB [Fidelibacterota bacterium]
MGKNKEKKLSHLDEAGDVRMVDVSDKDKTMRVARAQGFIEMKRGTLEALSRGDIPKGNVLTTAKIAGIQAAKKTFEVIPLCHPIPLSWVDLDFTVEDNGVRIEAVVKTTEATGVEMEALTAVSVAALTIYDMCKSVDKTLTISGIRLTEKTSGRGKPEPSETYRPRVGVMVISDSVHAGKARDTSGEILKHGFKEGGCTVDHFVVLPDGSDELEDTVKSWIAGGVDLVLTTGGTGLGPRDLTVPVLTELFDTRLSGVEQALHASGRRQGDTAMLSRLAAGRVDDAIVICLPGSSAACQDALRVLIPGIFHAFPVMRGKDHPREKSP